MIIYKATNIVNGNFYIGKTQVSIETRRRGHYKACKVPKQYFHLAIVKYGRDNFKWEMLDNSASNEVELNALEIKYIAELKPQYNMTKGGDGLSGRPAWNKGIKQDSETKRKISLTLTGRKNPFSDKHRESLSKSRKEMLNDPIRYAAYRSKMSSARLK